MSELMERYEREKKAELEKKEDINKIFQLINKEIIEDEDFNKVSRLFFENNLSFNQLQMNLDDKNRKSNLEKLMIFADHLIFNRITSIDTIKNRCYMDKKNRLLLNTYS